MHPLMQQQEIMPGGENASPEEQGQYDRIVSGAHEHLWGKGGEAIEGMFESHMRPKDVVATITASLLQKGIEVVRSPEDADGMFSDPSLKSVDVSDKEVSGDVKLKAGAAIMEDVLDFGAETGHLSFDSKEDEEEFKAEAVQLTIDMFLEQAQKRGEVDSEGAFEEMKQLVRLDGYEMPPPVARQDQVAEGVGQALGTPPAGPPDGMPLMAGPGGPPPDMGAMPPQGAI